MSSPFKCKRLRYKCICKECGKEAFVDDAIVLDSTPPKYNYYCIYCGEHGFVNCDEVEILGETL